MFDNYVETQAIPNLSSGLDDSVRKQDAMRRAHELAMHAAYKACGMAEDIADAYNTAYKIVMEANHG